MDVQIDSIGYRSILLKSYEHAKCYAAMQFPTQLETFSILLPSFSKFKEIKANGFIVKRVVSDVGETISVIRKPNGNIQIFHKICLDLFELLDIFNGEITDSQLLNRIHCWVQFMEKSKSAMSKAKELGLYGEVKVVLQLIESGVPTKNVLNAWVGPERGLHDFVFPQLDIEVKTTTSESASCKISSLDQLDNLSNSNLYLSLVKIAESPSGLTLSEFIEDTKALFSVEDRSAFEEKLMLEGYHSKLADGFDTKYTISELLNYLVDDSFPKLTPVNVPVQISHASYSVNLREIRQNPELYNQIRELIWN
nr:hypothetical protein BCU00_18050 [Vibrio breoganii]